MSREDIDFEFFPLVITHTRQGFYADPIYGGNKDQIGWKHIGFPGPDSLEEVHSGRFSTLAWFFENPTHPGEETRKDGKEKEVQIGRAPEREREGQVIENAEDAGSIKKNKQRRT